MWFGLARQEPPGCDQVAATSAASKFADHRLATSSQSARAARALGQPNAALDICSEVVRRVSPTGFLQSL